jgi:CDP-diacylglycerol--glycerol-3-phosphate 3-phosphatidyltransferase
MKFFTPPNQMTLARILLTPVFVLFLLSDSLALHQWSLVILILAAVTDWYDGWLARRWGYVSRWGTFFDPLADKVVTSGALLAYAYLGLVQYWMVWIIVIRDAVITLARSYAEYKGNPIDTSKLAKTKTFAQFVVIYYILILFVGQNTPAIESQFGWIIRILFNYTVVYSLMLIITGITLWTGIVYFYDNWKILRELFDFMIKVPNPNGGDPTVTPSLWTKLFASAFFSGYAPIASGTVGSAVAVAIYCIPGFSRLPIIGSVIIATIVLGIWTSGIMEKRYGHDPAEVTIDEVAGMWISLLLLPKSIPIVIVGFFLFRFFDIVKPYPARRFDEMQGGFGIMMDDVICGIYANLVLQVLILIPFFRHLLV